MSNFYANGGVVAGSNPMDSGLGGGDPSASNAIDLFANRMLQNLQQKQHGADLKRDNENLLLGRNLFSDLNAKQMASGKPGEYYNNGVPIIGGGGSGGGVCFGDPEALTMRRQLLSNNSEDDEGVGLELQETSPPNNNSLMKMMMMEGTDEGNKFLWSTMNAGQKPVNGEIRINGSASNHSSDSSCLSSASPSPTLNKFFTFQNGAKGNAGSTKARNSQEGNCNCLYFSYRLSDLKKV